MLRKKWLQKEKPMGRKKVATLLQSSMTCPSVHLSPVRELITSYPRKGELTVTDTNIKTRVFASTPKNHYERLPDSDSTTEVGQTAETVADRDDSECLTGLFAKTRVAADSKCRQGEQTEKQDLVWQAARG